MVARRARAASAAPSVAGVLDAGRTASRRGDRQGALGRDRGKFRRIGVYRTRQRRVAHGGGLAHRAQRRGAGKGLLRRRGARGARQPYRGGGPPIRRKPGAHRARRVLRGPRQPRTRAGDIGGPRGRSLRYSDRSRPYLSARTIVEQAPQDCFAGNGDPDPPRRVLRIDAVPRLNQKIDAAQVAPPPPPPPPDATASPPVPAESGGTPVETDALFRWTPVQAHHWKSCPADSPRCCGACRWLIPRKSSQPMSRMPPRLRPRGERPTRVATCDKENLMAKYLFLKQLPRRTGGGQRRADRPVDARRAQSPHVARGFPPPLRVKRRWLSVPRGDLAAAGDLCWTTMGGSRR